jgi:hypothetical protein
MHTFLLDGRECEITVPVRANKALKFSSLGKRTETRGVVLHHTGGRRGVEGVFQTLQGKGYSVHFVIEADGTIWQLADAALRCAHAGTANGFTVGVEVVNHAGPKNLPRDAHREIVREEIHGRERDAATFTVPQVQSSLALTHALCKAFGLPHRVPEREGKLVTEVLSKAEMRSFRGVLGHFHIKETKRDPGLVVLRAIQALPARKSVPPPPDWVV